MSLPGSGTWTLDHQLVVPFDLAGGSTPLEMGLVGGFRSPAPLPVLFLRFVLMVETGSSQFLVRA